MKLLKIKYLSVTLFLLLFLSVGCEKKKPIDNQFNGNQLTIKFSFDNNSTLKKETKSSIAPNAASPVSAYLSELPYTLSVLVFKVDGLNETFAYLAKYQYDTDFKYNQSITVTLRKSENINDKYRLVLLGNPPKFLTPSVGTTKADVYKSIQYPISSKWPIDTYELSPFTIRPMWGETTAEAILSPTNPFKDANTNLSSIGLVDAMALVELGINYFDNQSNETRGINTFLLRSVFVYNIPSKGCVAPLSYSELNTKPNIPTSITFNSPFDYSGIVAQGCIPMNNIIIPESSKPINRGDDNTTCIIIGGLYSSTGNFSGVPETFYRIDFMDYTTGEMLPILRKHRYRFNITSISGPGFASKEDAVKSFDSPIKFTLTWNNMYIPVEDKMLYLNSDKNSIDLPYNDNNISGAFTINTNYIVNGTPDWTVTSNQEWLTPNKNGNQIDIVTTGYKQPNNETGPRSAILTISAGPRLTLKLKVFQYPLISNDPAKYANCYIVEPNSVFSFQALNIPNPSAAMYSEVVWMSAAGLIKGTSLNQIDGKITIKTAPNIQGNAVVALKTSAGVIKWSWHIWVTQNKNLIEAGVLGGNGKYYLDRNLGALANHPNAPNGGGVATIGLLYQHSRKDPFPCSSSTTSIVEPYIYKPSGATTTVIKTNSTSITGTVDYAISHPDEFLYNLSTTCWQYDNNNINYWGGVSGSTTVKTKFDPCPKGWKVPSSGSIEWGSLGEKPTEYYSTVNSIVGYQLSRFGGWFSASGKRSGEDGNLYSNSVGYSWTAVSSSGTSSHAMHLHCYWQGAANSVYIWDNDNGDAFPIRCIKDQ